VTHVISHLDVVGLLAANKAALGGMADQTLEQLGLDEVRAWVVGLARAGQGWVAAGRAGLVWRGLRRG
jgi:hypothetical protein